MSSLVSLPPSMEYLPSGVWAQLNRDRKPRTHPLDDIRRIFWMAFRHLFPEHAVALQDEHGSVLVSWSLLDDPHARSAYAAPIMLRFEPELIELMEESGPEHRRRVTGLQEQFLRAGLVGYDPYAIANARVIVLG